MKFIFSFVILLWGLAQAQVGYQKIRAFPSLSFVQPLFLTYSHKHDPYLYLVEQRGRIYRFKNEPGVRRKEIFLDISAKVETQGNEEGLLGLAFDPDYENNKTFYVYYSQKGRKRTVLSKFIVEPGGKREIPMLHFDQPFSNHNGGMIAFGLDKMLYIGLGDGGSGGDPLNKAQDLSSPLGKLLRIDPHAPAPWVPADNPFVGRPGRDDIYAYGLRNPWRFSFDQLTGKLWLADVGQNAFEEVNIVESGDNLGWRLFEGLQSFRNPGNVSINTTKKPVLVYGRDRGFTVIGGYVYRGSKLPSLYGHYVFADLGGDVWKFKVGVDPNLATINSLVKVDVIVSFGTDQAGELYMVSRTGGIYQLEEKNTAPEPDLPAKLSQTGFFDDVSSLKIAEGFEAYEVNLPLWSDGARKQRWFRLPPSKKIDYQKHSSWDFPIGSVLIKHFEFAQSTGTALNVETRVLVKRISGWKSFSYRWQADQKDATLLTGSHQELIPIQTPSGIETIKWSYPSRTQCFQCHTSSTGILQGLRTRQLNRNQQLENYKAKGLFSQAPVWEENQKLYGLDNPAGTLAQKVKGYLDVNCASCHNPQGAAPTNMDLSFHTKWEQMKILDTHPGISDLGLDQAKLVSPKHPERSVLLERMKRLDEHRMPKLGSSVLDKQAIQVVEDWILSL